MWESVYILQWTKWLYRKCQTTCILATPTHTGKGLLQQRNPQEFTHCAGTSRHVVFRWRSLSPTTFAAHPLTALNSLTKPRSLLWSQKRRKGTFTTVIHASNGLYFYTGAEVPNLSTMLYVCAPLWVLCSLAASSLPQTPCGWAHHHLVHSVRCTRQSDGGWCQSHREEIEQRMVIRQLW